MNKYLFWPVTAVFADKYAAYIYSVFDLQQRHDFRLYYKPIYLNGMTSKQSPYKNHSCYL